MGTLTVNATNGKTVAKGASYVVPFPSGKSSGNYLTTGATITTSDGSVYPVTVAFGASGITVTNPTGRDIASGGFDFIDLQTTGVLARFNAAGETKVLMGPKNTESSVVSSTLDPVSGKATFPTGGFPVPSLLDFSQWSTANAAAVISQLASIYNPKNVSGQGVYRSGTGTASSSGTTVTVDDVTGLAVGMRVTVIDGTGLFANSNATTTTEVQSINRAANTFVVTRAPTTTLVGATVYGCKVFKLATGPNTAEAASSWEGATYMPDGRVCFTPVSSANVGTFDPKTMTYFRGPAHGEAASAWGASTLGLDGNVYFANTNSGYYGRYNYQNNFYTRMAAASPPASSTTAFGGIIRVPDGRLVAVPVRSAYVDIFNPVANTVATVAHGLSGTDFFSSGTVHPNGKCYFSPWGDTCTRVGIFDPVTNTFSQGATVGTDVAVATKYEGGIVMPNGKICFVPNKATRIGIYEPLTDTWEDGPAHNLVTTNGVFSGGTLMADGRVLMVPRSANAGPGLFGIYDPINNCFSTNAGMTVYGVTANAMIGGCMTQGGRFVAAGYSSFPIVLDTESQTVNSHEMCLHPLYNKQ